MKNGYSALVYQPFRQARTSKAFMKEFFVELQAIWKAVMLAQLGKHWGIRVAPRTLFLMQTLSIITGATGWFLAKSQRAKPVSTINHCAP
jgi:hypothetical protein